MCRFPCRHIFFCIFAQNNFQIFTAMEEQILITYNDGEQFGGFGLFINSTDFRKSINEKSEKTEQIRAKLNEIIEIAKTINQ